MAQRLDQLFYSRTAREVAQDLLGKQLVRLLDGRRLSGCIVETEAYCDTEEKDLACHGDRANNGRPTSRTAVMFGLAGHAYVYFTYGVHWMFNIVTGQEGEASAVLIRALEPVEGLEVMAQRRNGRGWGRGGDVHDPAPVGDRGGLPRPPTSQNHGHNETPPTSPERLPRERFSPPLRTCLRHLRREYRQC